MSRNRRAKRRGRSRRDPSLEQRRRILVLCEGEETEPGYLQALHEELRPLLVQIVIEGYGEDPKALVERAVALKREAERDARGFPLSRRGEGGRWERGPGGEDSMRGSLAFETPSKRSGSLQSAALPHRLRSDVYPHTIRTAPP